MYSLHCLICGIVVPIFYALLTSKKNKMYQKFFYTCQCVSEIKFLDRKIKLMGDFEICNFNFLPENIDKTVCFFHFCQVIWRKCQKISSELYSSKKDFYVLARYIMVLPLISANRIDNILKMLKETFKEEHEQMLLDFFVKNYINGKYLIQYWNIRDSVIRCNNWLESFHSMLNRFSSLSHPSIYRLIPLLNNVILKERTKLFEVREKLNVAGKKKRQIFKNRSLETVITEEGTYSDIDLLKNLTNLSKTINSVFEEEEEENEMEMDEEYEEDATFDNNEDGEGVIDGKNGEMLLLDNDYESDGPVVITYREYREEQKVYSVESGDMDEPSERMAQSDVSKMSEDSSVDGNDINGDEGDITSGEGTEMSECSTSDAEDETGTIEEESRTRKAVRRGTKRKTLEKLRTREGYEEEDKKKPERSQRKKMTKKVRKTKTLSVNKLNKATRRCKK